MTSLDGPFLESARIVIRLAASPEVERRWHDDSALPLMGVGMLACHVTRQVVWARQILPVAASDAPLDEAAEHYRRAAWVTAESLDHPANDRSLDEEDASAGHAAMVERSESALEDVAQMLSSGGAQPVVTIPWQGWSLRRDDFLLTRMLEIIVHADDLARSVRVDTPRFPQDAYRPVLHLLADLAAEKHGQAALTSALSRGERQPDSISAF